MQTPTHARNSAPDGDWRQVARGFLCWFGLQFGYALLPDAWLAEVLFPRGIVRPLAWLVGLWPGVEARVAGSGLSGTHAHLFIVRGCDGSDLLFPLLALISASPARWPARLRAALLACALVHALNLLRLALLFWLAERRPELFDEVHEWVAPAVMVTALGGCWWWWVRAHLRRCASRATSTQGAQRSPASKARTSASQDPTGGP